MGHKAAQPHKRQTPRAAALGMMLLAMKGRANKESQTFELVFYLLVENLCVNLFTSALALFTVFSTS